MCAPGQTRDLKTRGFPKLHLLPHARASASCCCLLLHDGPRLKLCAGGGGEEGGRVLLDATSCGHCGDESDHHPSLPVYTYTPGGRRPLSPDVIFFANRFAQRDFGAACPHMPCAPHTRPSPLPCRPPPLPSALLALRARDHPNSSTTHTVSTTPRALLEGPGRRRAWLLPSATSLPCRKVCGY